MVSRQVDDKPKKETKLPVKKVDAATLFVLITLLGYDIPYW